MSTSTCAGPSQSTESGQRNRPSTGAGPRLAEVEPKLFVSDLPEARAQEFAAACRECGAIKRLLTNSQEKCALVEFSDFEACDKALAGALGGWGRCPEVLVPFARRLQRRQLFHATPMSEAGHLPGEELD